MSVAGPYRYDLVFALSDLLAPEWPGLTVAQQKSRYRGIARFVLVAWVHPRWIAGGTVQSGTDCGSDSADQPNLL